MTTDPLDRTVTSWVRSLRARNLATKTVKLYEYEARRLSAWLRSNTAVTDWPDMGRSHLEEYLVDTANTRASSGVSVAFRSLQQFFKWAEAEEEIDKDPTRTMKTPATPQPSVPVLSESQIKALLKACEGKHLTARRDMAIIRLFLDTGMRRDELTNLTVGHVDIDGRSAFVIGKGRKPRNVAFGAKAATALDRYVRAREKHKLADRDELWLASRDGVLGYEGVHRMLKRRAKKAGIPGLHAHVFRHTWAHCAQLEGRLHDQEIMHLGGWASRQMLSRYAASAASQRAVEAGKRTALGDNL